jgi:PAS domain S-box-containing protein
VPWNGDPEAARLNHDGLLLVEEHGELGLWAWDLEADRLRWSIGMYRLLGLPAFAQTPSLELFNSLVHPDDRADVRDTLDTLHTMGDKYQRLIRHDGELRWVRSSVRLIHSAAGLPERIVGATFDITAKVRADAAYQRENGLFDVVRELVGGTVWMSGIDGTGHLGLAGIEEVHPNDRAAVRDAWELARSTGRRYTADYRAKRNGAYVALSSRAVAVRDPLGTILAWVGYTAPQSRPDHGGEAVTRALRPSAGQIRGARGLLGWTATELAARSALSFSTIRRAEADGDRGVGPAAAAAIRAAFAAAGVTFATASDGTLSISLLPPARRQVPEPASAVRRASRKMNAP